MIADVIFQAQIDILKKFVGKILLCHLKRADFLGIIIDVDEEVALSRKDDIPSRNYIALKRPIYLALARRMNWTVLDGCNSVEENAREILELLSHDQK